ncbi:rod shape-determining protein MreC [Sulfurospirillum arcachonense]|uniref:rod shape-determining protein MreC n=1 Tax=Sulfurospirillum arcachonense TaxID=57666 RepID=UPI000469C79B|nr:rod shape-determining protein MreC [Sulfurospirillum arcachonense]
MNKIKFLVFIAIFVLLSLEYGSDLRGIFLKNTNLVIATYLDIKNSIEQTVDEHFAQQKEIVTLREENKKLKNSAELLSAFASKLNDVLKKNNVPEYEPKVKLVRSVAYSNLNDYYKVWIDYKDFNASRIYGLLDKGNSAGIVVEKDGNPMALLLGDPKSIFSVFVGDKKIPGVIKGKKSEVQVKYIPLWMNPKVGDEVVTSGLDGIFFGGVRVGVVKKVIKEELSKTAIIEPYTKINVPSYYHIIEKN